MKFEDNPILKEIDDNFVGIKELFDDNAKSHEILNDCLLSLNERINKIENILQAAVEAINEMETINRVAYKPIDQENYLSIKENLDLIYEKISKLEGKN